MIRITIIAVLLALSAIFLANLPQKQKENTIASLVFEIRAQPSIYKTTEETIKTETLLGYSYTGIHWSNNIVPYYIDNTAPITWRTTVQESFQTWTDIPGCLIVFNFAGIASVGAPEKIDGKNVVSYGNLDGADGTLARCTTWYYTQTKIIIEADISFDSGENWSVNQSCPANAYDVENACVHEIGHTLCLHDLSDPSQSEESMYAYSELGETKKRTLNFGDVSGASFIYPAPLIHDIAVINLTSSSAKTIQGETIQFNATFENKGNYSESLTATLKANESSIGGIENIFLPVGGLLTIPFNWDTNSSSSGKYQIAAYVIAVPGEENLQDNVLIGNTVEIEPQIHDLAVTAINTTHLTYQSHNVFINATIMNMGNQKESFEISFYANSSKIGNMMVTDLPANTTTTVCFLWNTSNFTAGNYTLSSQIEPVPEEIDTINNALAEGWVVIVSHTGGGGCGGRPPMCM